MKSVVVNMMKCNENSIIASNRIARFLATFLGCNLIDSKDTCYGVYDRVIVVNGPMLYCGFREELQALVERAKDVVWVENDYAIAAPKFIKDRVPLYLSACENFRELSRYAYVNWNQLTYHKGLNIAIEEARFPGVYYYGAFRPGRVADFEKYLRPDIYPVHISSSKMGIKKFHAICPGARFVAAGNLFAPGGLAHYQSTIYIEDKKSHKIYTSPANRFYEALSAGTLQFFDKACVHTFERDGIDVTPWAVDGPSDIARFLSDADELRRGQLEFLGRRDYRASLVAQLKEALIAMD